MVERGIKGDIHSDTSVATVGKTRPEDPQGRGGDGGGDVGYNGFPPKREGGLLRYRYC